MAFTGQLGTHESRLGNIVLGFQATGGSGGSVFESGFEDTLTFLDTFHGLKSPWPFNDSLTFSEIMIGDKNHLSDTLTFSETLTGFKLQLEDTLEFSEVLSVSNTINVELSDTLSFTDAIYKTIPAVMDTDTLTFTDDAVGAVWIDANFSDTVTLVEDLLSTLTYERTLAEAIEFSEQLTTVMVKLLEFTDNVTFAETLDGIAARVLGDNVTFSDAITAFVARVFQDTLEFGDTLTRTTNYLRPTADNLIVFDSLTYTATLRKDMEIDTVSFTDTMVGHRIKPLETDTLTFGESLTETVSTPLQTDSLTFSDSFSFNKIKSVTISDNLVFTETQLANLILTRQIFELIDFVEDMKGIRVKFGVMNDSFTFTDQQLREVHQVLIDTSLVFSDSLTFTKISDRTLEDVLTYVEDLDTIATLSRTFNEALTFNHGFLVKLKPGPNSPPGDIPNSGVITDPVVQGVIKILPQLVLKGWSRTIVLPPPEFNDFGAGQGKIAVQRSMTGSVRVYRKRTEREKLNYRFVLPKYKSDEFKLFLQDEINNPIKMIDWEGNHWDVRILSNSVDFVETRRWSPCGNAVDVTIEFVGTRYA